MKRTPPIFVLDGDGPTRRHPARTPVRGTHSDRQIEEFARFIEEHDIGSRSEPATTDPDAHYIPMEEFA